MQNCPNCGQPVEGDARVCPHCGAGLTPPLPVLQGPPPRPQVSLLTGAAWLDVVVGLLAVFGSLLLMGIGVVIPFVLYFILRPRYPVFARGMGYGLGAIAVLILGAFALCVVGISRGGL